MRISWLYRPARSRASYRFAAQITLFFMLTHFLLPVSRRYPSSSLSLSTG